VSGQHLHIDNRPTFDCIGGIDRIGFSDAIPRGGPPHRSALLVPLKIGHQISAKVHK
jgi:hypothetical protein